MKALKTLSWRPFGATSWRPFGATKRPGVAVLLAGLVGCLAGCGVDGEPIRPSAGAGVRVGTDGVSASTGATVRSGPFSAAWGVSL